VNAGVDHHFFSPPPETGPTRHLPRLLCRQSGASQGPSLSSAGLESTRFDTGGAGFDRRSCPGDAPIIKQWAPRTYASWGFLPPSELADWYRASHLFVFPSVNEGLARVIFEAMACGLPVVATEQSGAEDCITRGIEGNVVPARNVEALAEAILWHYRNPEASAAMGSAARSKIERQFTLPQYVERVIGIYRTAADRLAGTVTAHPS
jgi:glycosyltransferase involved in cell wall biosynthesis